MSDVLLVQNTRIEGSGYLGELLSNDGFDITSIHAKYEAIPEKKFSFVVILGAPESANDDLLPFLLTVTLQKLAYYSALKKGYDIDKPRNLAKSVTVE